MHADFNVVLDACVLANASLCDLLLRLAETPRLYLPRWTPRILDEVQNTQQHKLTQKWPKALSDKWRAEVEKHFPEAMIQGFEPFESMATNDEGDRHVLAAAIKDQAEVIVTFNLKHFKKEALEPFGVVARHPAEFLITLYSIDPGVFVSKISAIATARKKPIGEVLLHLRKSVPRFVDSFVLRLGIELPEG